MTFEETALVKLTPTDKGAIALYLPACLLDECIFEECEDDQHGQITLIYPPTPIAACFEVLETVREIMAKVEADLSEDDLDG